MLRDLVLKNRSYRRFYQDTPVSMDILRELIDLARQTAAWKNCQPIKYILSNTPEKNAKIFSALAWAAYLKDWGGPLPGEQPSAYVIVLLDKTISQSIVADDGITSQTILLGAVEKGFGGCIIASVKKEELAKILNLDERYEIRLVIALGKPKEKVVIEELAASGDFKYWRDADGTHHVPKRALNDIILDF